MSRWLLPAGLLLALAGYFGSWIAYPVAGLALTGLDFGEYVKFLPVVRNEEVLLWRAGFYLPLIAVSTAATLAAFRHEYAYSWWARAALLAIAIVAALNLMPPAWTPSRLIEAEFRFQTGSLLILLIGVAFAPFWGLMPKIWAATLVTVLAVLSIVVPLHGFFAVLPAITELYGEALSFGWGPWCMTIGLLIIVTSYWIQPSTKQFN